MKYLATIAPIFFSGLGRRSVSMQPPESRL